MTNPGAVLLNQNEGESFWVLGDLYTFKVTGKETNGEFMLMEQVIQPQSGPPPHIHHAEDETFYVLEGRFLFLCGKEERILETGCLAYIPKGTVHTFKNIAEHEGRLLVTVTPAGLEDFFYSIGTPLTNSSTPPPFDPSVMDRILQLAEKYHMKVLAPDNH